MIVTCHRCKKRAVFGNVIRTYEINTGHLTTTLKLCYACNLAIGQSLTKTESIIDRCVNRRKAIAAENDLK